MRSLLRSQIGLLRLCCHEFSCLGVPESVSRQPGSATDRIFLMLKRGDVAGVLSGCSLCLSFCCLFMVFRITHCASTASLAVQHISVTSSRCLRNLVTLFRSFVAKWGFADSQSEPCTLQDASLKPIEEVLRKQLRGTW